MEIKQKIRSCIHIYIYNTMAHLLTPSVLGAVLINSILRKTSTENDERCNFHDQRNSENSFQVGGRKNGAVNYFTV